MLKINNYLILITECILRNILCNSSYFSEWEVEVEAECIMNKDKEVSKH